MAIPLLQHPFPVEAHFDRVIALSFAFPSASLQHLVPQGLELDTFQDLGFLTVALVWTRQLRPAGFPPILGKNFFLAGYRIFTRLSAGGRTRRGLKILGSDTDKSSMVLLGNLLTGYNYHKVRTSIEESSSTLRIRTFTRGNTLALDLGFRLSSIPSSLPPDSPFPDWRSARRFAGPMPFTFSPCSRNRWIVVEGSRTSWTPRPIEVTHAEVPRLDPWLPPSSSLRLANAFIVENIPYRWSRGRILSPDPSA